MKPSVDIDDDMIDEWDSHDQWLDISYRDGHGNPSQRVVKPQRLHLDNRERIVLIGWCATRKDFRHFRLDRITSYCLVAAPAIEGSLLDDTPLCALPLESDIVLGCSINEESEVSDYQWPVLSELGGVCEVFAGRLSLSGRWKDSELEWLLPVLASGCSYQPVDLARPDFPNHPLSLVLVDGRIEAETIVVQLYTQIEQATVTELPF